MVFKIKIEKDYYDKIEKINKGINTINLWEGILEKKMMEYNQDKVEHKAEMYAISGVIKQDLEDLRNLSNELLDDVRELQNNKI